MTQVVNAATELAREHDEIDRLATRIATLAPGTERTELVRELCARFLIHAQVEERYLHPAVRTLLRNGVFAVTFQARRNRAVARTIACVERGGLEADEYDIVVSHLVVGVQDHVERQDAFLLPALVDVCPIEQINRLGEQLREGIANARRAVERAGARASEQQTGSGVAPGGTATASAGSVGSAASAAGSAGDGARAGAHDHDARTTGREQRPRGLRGLLRWFVPARRVRGGPAADAAH